MLYWRSAVREAEFVPIEQDFAETYQRMTDEELAQVLADRRDLVPEAAAALDLEVGRRQVAVSATPEWVRSPGSSERVGSLEDYGQYTKLRDRKEFVNTWAIRLPFILFALSFVFDKVAPRFGLLGFGISVSLVLVIVAYGLTLTFRFTAWKCPQCGDRFGLGDECRSCGFPRGTRQRSNAI